MDLPSLCIADTGPLLEFLILTHQKESGVRWWARDEQMYMIHTESDRVLFDRMLERNYSAGVRTAGGVVAEIQGKIRNAEGRGRRGGNDSALGRNAWPILRRHFERWRLMEGHFALLDMDIDSVAELGPVDVSLIELAKAAMSEGMRPVVLTNDGKLVRRCRSREIPAEFGVDALESFRAREP